MRKLQEVRKAVQEGSVQGKGSAKNQSWALGFGSQIKNQNGSNQKTTTFYHCCKKADGTE